VSKFLSQYHFIRYGLLNHPLLFFLLSHDCHEKGHLRYVRTASSQVRETLYLSPIDRCVRSSNKIHNNPLRFLLREIIPRPSNNKQRSHSCDCERISEVETSSTQLPPSMRDRLGRLKPGRTSLMRYCNIERYVTLDERE